MPARRLRYLAASLAAGILTSCALSSPALGARWEPPALTPGPADALTLALDHGDITPPSYALWRARSLFHLSAVRARFGAVSRVDPHAATLVLRDLVARYRQLGPAERAEARRILARPDSGSGGTPGGQYTVPARVDCKATFCLHWVDTTADAPAAVDANGNGIPDYVDTAEQVVQTVWDKEVVDLGYRAPRSDETSANHGPDGKLDVYLADLGNDGLYGYCTTDDPAAFSASPQPVSAYCVVDNDFSPSQYGGYGGATGVQALEVTVAHEFFHAVQAAYDLFDDLVLLEGTAVWMEDEVYNDINDNYYYLQFSALKNPAVPFDDGQLNPSRPDWGFEYGAFIFYKYLSERFKTPDIIRRIWEFADATVPARNEYSLQAINSALRERNTTFRKVFADWTAANAFPAASYLEGAAYPVPPVASKLTLLARAKKGSGSLTLAHLTSRYIELVPGPRLGPKTRLRIRLDLPVPKRGSAATVLTVSRNGGIVATRATLNLTGDGLVTVPFSHARVAAVMLVLTNAGDDFACNHGTIFACGGIPGDDHLTFKYDATVT